MDRTNRMGFTLTELVVVMAIVSLIAMLLLPVMARARSQARQVACLSNLQQLGKAHQLYLQDGGMSGSPPGR